MRSLILVKHSLPEILPTVSASRWLLSDEGRRRCEPLAERLRVFHPTAIVTSVEPKAAETGAIVARKLAVDPELALRGATGRFVERVERARELAAGAGEDWAGLELDAQEQWYRRAKDGA